jgi:hypothetical protein
LEKQYRYEIHRALSHPWITRSIESSIPLNTFEKIWVNEGKMKLKLVIKLIIRFLNALSFFLDTKY